MSDLTDRIQQDKWATRKRLAALPFAEKLAMMEKMRDRGLLLAANPLRRRAALMSSAG